VTLAKERSKGPSGPSGGDLGYFGKEAMVEPFAEAAFQMQKGDISAPVKTQFGWHVIKLEDRRSKPTPKLEDVRDQIFQVLIGEARQDIYVKMRAEADVQFVKADPASE
jgi:peptidyl-prolyl cis-trans isomerase C